MQILVEKYAIIQMKNRAAIVFVEYSKKTFIVRKLSIFLQ